MTARVDHLAEHSRTDRVIRRDSQGLGVREKKPCDIACNGRRILARRLLRVWLGEAVRRSPQREWAPRNRRTCPPDDPPPRLAPATPGRASHRPEHRRPLRSAPPSPRTSFPTADSPWARTSSLRNSAANASIRSCNCWLMAILGSLLYLVYAGSAHRRAKYPPFCLPTVEQSAKCNLHALSIGSSNNPCNNSVTCVTISMGKLPSSRLVCLTSPGLRPSPFY